MVKLTIDFETVSDINLKIVGAWKYSIHPSTNVLTISWDDGLSGDGQWRLHDAPPSELFLAVAAADVVEAHNSFFEYCIWRNVCVARYRWPIVPDEKWRCSQSKAAACSLSRKLGEAGAQLQLKVVKDEEGKKAMQTLTKGQKLKDEDLWVKMLAYNRQDVAAEECLSAALPDLSPRELLVWQASERMNRRGFPVDTAGAEQARWVIKDCIGRLRAEYELLTGIEEVTQRAKLIVWLNNHGVRTDNTQAKTLDAILKDTTITEDVRRALQIMRAVGRSSVTKYETILDAVDRADNRIRGCFMYHGAGTGRWAGKLVQPHNFPKGDIKDMDAAWRVIHTGNVDVIDLAVDPMEFCSSALRGVICAPEGRDFLVGDYASIEARVVAWLADQQTLLKLFHNNGDVYLAAAEAVYNRKLNKKDNPKERQFGKQEILGLGFGMGYIKFLIRCRNEGISFTKEQICSVVPAETRRALAEEICDDWDRVQDTFSLAIGEDADFRRDILDLVFMKYTVNLYRDNYPEIPYLWRAYEEAAKEAVRHPGEVFKTHRTAWKYADRFLMCKLPSGRVMRYLDPHFDKKGALWYWAAKGETGVFVRTSTYGGKLTENVVQAVARDVMADAMLRLEDTPPYNELVLTVHDELGVEIDKGVGTVKEFEVLMAMTNIWASGLPVSVEAWRGQRYRK